MQRLKKKRSTNIPLNFSKQETFEIDNTLQKPYVKFGTPEGLLRIF